MKAAILHGPKDLRIEEVDDPKLEPDGVILRVRACGVCGGDLGWYERGGWGGAAPQSIEGHELSGDVVDVGANVTRFKMGDRVGVGAYGGYAEYIAVKGGFPLPDDMSYEVGATIEPIGVSTLMAMNAEPQGGETVVVFGAGAIGQGAWQVFKAMGASKAIVVEVAKRRLEVAKSTGADMVIDATKEDPVTKVNEVTSDVGADIVALCTTSPVAWQQAFEMVRGGGLYQMQVKPVPAPPGQPHSPFSAGGKVVIVAGTPPSGWSPPIVQKCIRVIGSWGGRGKEAYDLLMAGKVNSEQWITHTFPLENIREAFEAALDRDNSVKVMVNP